MREATIYKVTCTCHPEDGIRYVGQTVVSVNSRRGVHLWNARTPSSKSYRSHFSNWIRKHGEDNIRFGVLESTTEDLADVREVWWIAKLRREGAKLTNVLEGGSQPRGHRNPSLSERFRGAGNPMYGRDRSELMAYVRSFQGGPSEETKRIWSEQRTGEGNSRAVLTDEAVRKLREQPKKRGLFSEWARRYGVSPQTIYLAYNRKTWKHVE